jgi:hypothetical protein
MEEKKDYNKQQPLQKFYFTDDGKLVVESNKGVWVDGEPYVKMYGNFTCNAKTLGAIISKLKGIKVEVGNINTYINHNREYYDIRRGADILEEQSYCVLGVDNEKIEEIIEQKAEQKAEEKYQQKLTETEFETNRKLHAALLLACEKFNALPWYKRMFKKIEIK